MKPHRQSVLNFATHAALSALGWVAVATVNAKIFGNFLRGPGAHWIFLPAGFRPLAVLLFGKAGALGLAAGTWITVSSSPGASHLQAAVHSLVNAVATFLGVAACKKAMRIPDDLSGLQPRQVVAISAACAALNTLASTAIFWRVGSLARDRVLPGAVFVGDLAGSCILLLAVSSALAWAMPRHPARPG